jgi:AraC-like DNA-binding protein/quercetin dioxygenase-like cupin family protein
MAYPQQLPDHRPKSYWTVDDIFGAQRRSIVCFVHRDYRIGMHAHAFTEVNVVIAGQGRHYMSGTSFATAPGTVFVVPPDLRHGYEAGPGHHVYHLLMHPLFWVEHRQRLWTLPGFLLLFTVEPHFRAETQFRYGLRLDRRQLQRATVLLGDIEAETKIGDPSSFVAMEALTLDLIARLCRWYGEQHGVGEGGGFSHGQTQALQVVFQHVAEHYAGKLALADLARVACMERSHFGRLFHKVTGLTPMDFVREHRVKVARQLLAQPDANVSAIALAVGFYDAAHFSRTFSRLVGMSPKRYQRMWGLTGNR